MEFNQVINSALPILYVIAGIVLIWLIVELVITVRRARQTVEDIKKQIEPTLEHVESITASLEPATKKIDPLVDRVSLTVDAANLEIMRLDQILEDVGEVTDTVSSTVSTVDAIASAPMDLVNNVTSKVRGAFRSRGASEESIALGEEKAEAAKAEREAEKDADQSEKKLRAVERIEQARQAEKEGSHNGSVRQGESSDQSVGDEGVSQEKQASGQEGYFTYGAKAANEVSADAAHAAASGGAPESAGKQA